MATPIFVVDAFADRAFTGNPAGVCLLQEPASEAWMQAVAAEMKHSETAFLNPERDGIYRLRWFTPTVEVALCGHATLAAAHVLWEEGAIGPAHEALFETRSGRLAAHRDGDRIVLDFPADPPVPVAPPHGLLDALNLDVVAAARTSFDYLLELGTESEVRDAVPDLRALAAIEMRGLIITSVADEGTGADIVSRFFAPGAGIDEDPVTGSAHCALAPYWAPRLGERLVARQLSARGGTLWTALAGDRVLLAGHAVTVLSGALQPQ